MPAAICNPLQLPAEGLVPSSAEEEAAWWLDVASTEDIRVHASQIAMALDLESDPSVQKIVAAGDLEWLGSPKGGPGSADLT